VCLSRNARPKKSFVHHKASGKKLTFGELAEAAAKQSPPEDVPLKDPKEFKLIGKSLKRLDSLEKSNGTGVFGIDVSLPKMLVAAISRPPVFGGKVKNIDSTHDERPAGEMGLESWRWANASAVDPRRICQANAGLDRQRGGRRRSTLATLVLPNFSGWGILAHSRR
jgi:hypothetical protein